MLNYSSAWYPVCNIFLTAVSEGIFEYPIRTAGFTAKCPRTQGAAYYNFLTIIRYYSKMLSDTAVKKILQTPPGACIKLCSISLEPHLGVLGADSSKGIST